MSSAINTTQSASLLKSFGVVKITGEDSIKFLQGQITVNAEDIKQHQLLLAAICNPQGRCISLFFITRKDQDIWLILKRDTIESTIANLKKYAVFYKVDISDYSEQNHLYGFSQLSAENMSLIESFEPAIWPAQNITIVMVNENERQTIEEICKETIPLSSEQNWLFGLTNQRVAWLTEESQSQFLPHNLDLPQLSAVDFKKGCFTGQEVIARMQYKGKLKSHLQLFHADSTVAVAPMDNIFVDDKSAAQVICSAKGENNRTALLALVKDRYLDSKIFRLKHEKGIILKLINSN